VVTPERALVPVAVVEAVSLLVLLGFAVGRAAGGPDLSATLGPIHGIVFCAYVVVVLQARPRLGWTTARTVLTLLPPSSRSGEHWSPIGPETGRGRTGSLI
jgi:integral membrane protein